MSDEFDDPKAFEKGAKPDQDISQSDFRPFVWEIIKIVFISLAIVIPIRFYIAQPFFVRGASMEPNFKNGDYLIINEVNYRFDEPKRGEVVVFRFPEDPRQFFIKRIIGLPGETIQIQGGRIKIFNSSNPLGFFLDESDYLSLKTRSFDDNLRVKLDKDEYFVLGDNRNHSSDSRRWGALPRKNIIGKAFFRIWPFNDFGKIE